MINCTPKLGGQFELESGGQFAPKLVVNLHWNRMVNLTGFSKWVAYALIIFGLLSLWVYSREKKEKQQSEVRTEQPAQR